MGGPCEALCGKCSPVVPGSLAALPLLMPFIPESLEYASATTDCDMGMRLKGVPELLYFQSSSC